MSCAKLHGLCTMSPSTDDDSFRPDGSRPFSAQKKHIGKLAGKVASTFDPSMIYIHQMVLGEMNPLAMYRVSTDLYLGKNLMVQVMVDLWG